MKDFSQFQHVFLEEASRYLETMENVLLDLDKDPNNKDLIEQVFRVMHTLKGVGSMYGFDKVSEFTHGLENIYDLIREGQLDVSNAILDVTLLAVDHIKNLLEDKCLEIPENIANHSKLEVAIENCMGEKWSLKYKRAKEREKYHEVDHIKTYNILFYPNATILENNIDLFTAFKELIELSQVHFIKNRPGIDNQDHWSIFIVTQYDYEEIENALFFVMDYCIITKVANFNIFNEEELLTQQQKLIDEAMSCPVTDKDKTTSADNNKDQIVINSPNTITEPSTSRISVDSSKLDELMYLVSELITTNSQLKLLSKKNNFDTIRAQLEKIDKLSKQFRNNALEIRLIPLSDISIRFHRLIRDLSKQLNKDVDFITQGADTELDKNTIDIITEPLVHIIRNSMDHGIETPEERDAQGKDPRGEIKLSAHHSGNYIFIEIKDNGKGIDLEKVKEKAINKGIITDKAILSDKEILDLIFVPGFSTNSEVTSVSGRGVGMDVVKKRLAEVRGEVEITTKKGEGTTITIKLQQSIAILDTLLVKSDNTNLMVPIFDIEVCIQENYHELLKRKNTETLSFDGELIPFISMRDELDIKSSPPLKARCLIIKKNNERFAIIVDDIIGQHQAVLKSLGKMLDHHDQITAASFLGDGKVAFLIDTNILFKKIQSRQNPEKINTAS